MPVPRDHEHQDRPTVGVVPEDRACLHFEDLSVDLDAYRVIRSGRVVPLGPREYRLLCFFLRHPGRVFSREELIENLWPADAIIDIRTVDAYIARLRRALAGRNDADLIRTVRTVGYALG